MTGYFSKIARQSGVRLANRPALLPGQASAAPPLPPRIDRHEVVMVGPDPSAAMPSTPSRVEAKAIPESQKAPVTEGRERRSEVHQPPPERSDARQKMSAPSEPPAVRNLEVDPASVDDPPPPHSKSNDPVRLEVSDKTVLVPPAVQPPAQPVKTADHVDHFAETIKIMSGREVSKDEASSILVREIHDWIAAGPTEPDVRVEEVVPRDHAVVKSENVEVLELEPGVVRISGELVTRREAEPKTESFPKPVEAASIHEQTLDLSIGSINVVIEGDPVAALQPQQPAARSADTTNQTSRSPSRLRRNYL